MARFDTRFGRLYAHTTAPIGGIAFAGDRGIARVEVSIDGGRTWAPAALEPPLSPFTWVLWSYDWQVGAPGRYWLIVRAVDGDGVPQVAERRTSYPSGATGYHTLDLDVR